MRRIFRSAIAPAGVAVTLAAGLLTASVITAVAASAAAGCSASYSVGSQWQGGFTANVNITNLGSALNGWTVSWTFAAGQQVTQGWNAVFTQSGASVTVVNEAYNASLGANATASFGFNAAWNNVSNPVPVGFSLNGTACTGAITATTTAPATRPPTTAPPTTAPPTTTAPSGPTVTVAQDGSGNYTSVQAAVNAVPSNNTQRFTINIKAGTYVEPVTIPSNKPYISFVGLGSSASAVVISYNRASDTPKSGGGTYGTSGSASVTINAHDFTAKNLTFANTFNEAASSFTNKQAVAVLTSADRLVFDNVRFLGNQDTLYLNSPSTSTVGRAYFRGCYIEGDVDFIFGRGTGVFDRCEIHSLTRGSSSNNGFVTAASTSISNPYGFLFDACTLTSNAPAKTVYLGRPWHPSGDVNAIAQVVFRNSTLGAHIKDSPWTDMSGFSWKDARFFEYQNTGAGATITSDRPQLTAAQAATLTPQRYLAGSDGWNPIY